MMILWHVNDMLMHDILGDWIDTKVVHFLNHGAHFYKVPFLWTPITNNKTYQIENLKLIYITNLIMRITI
jgi:hypothetical protein